MGILMSETILSHVEERRGIISASLDANSRGINGQYLTPGPVAKYMAEMFANSNSSYIRLLDPGAGSGALFSAFLDALSTSKSVPRKVEIVAYENDCHLFKELSNTAKVAEQFFINSQVDLQIIVRESDFILEAVSALQPNLLSESPVLGPFTHIIINPPYRKLATSSEYRKNLSQVGIDVTNLYSAFVALSVKLMNDGGELVAITPRSFCNGPYFRSFRKLLAIAGHFSRIHVFDSRTDAFKEDEVLQENVIFNFKKGIEQNSVEVSSSPDRSFRSGKRRIVPYSKVLDHSDRDLIIHIPSNEFDEYVLDRLGLFKLRLSDHNLSVSTGPVVDFRLKSLLRDSWAPGRAPMIYPYNIEGNRIQWPKAIHRKPSAIEINGKSIKWLLPNGNYVLIKRFSSKEEARRLYPAYFSAFDLEDELIAFENHLNVIHSKRRGISPSLAKGITAYLASTIVDLYFRQFSGHTQVNASDIRNLPFPDRSILQTMAIHFQDGFVNRQEVDDALENIFIDSYGVSSPNPVELHFSIAE